MASKKERIELRCYRCNKIREGHWVRNADTRGELAWRCTSCLREITGNRPWEDNNITLEPLMGNKRSTGRPKKQKEIVV